MAFGAIQIRSHERIDQCDQCRGWHNGIKFFKHQHVKQCELMVKEACSKIEPLLALVLMVTRVLGRRLVGELFMVPSQHQCISELLRQQAKKFGMHGFGLSNRGEDIVQMGAKRLQQFWQHRSIDLFDQAAQEPQLGADASDRTEPTAGGTQVEGVVEQMEQEIEVIVACSGVLTRMMGVFIVLETLVEMGRACGVGACGHGLGLLGNGRIGCALQLAAPVKEVPKRLKPITHPTRVLARRMRARHEATSPIGGHADAVEVGLTEGCTMGWPGLGRALRGQLSFQDGRTLRLNRDQDRLMAGKNLVAEIQHHCVRGHREGRRQSRAGVVEACTEISHGVRLVLAGLED